MSASAADRMLTLSVLGWPFKPGQKVRVKLGDDWRADWQDTDPLYVIGCTLDRENRVRVHVSENWPQDGGIDDILADDLEEI
jgi:hypothetical protein